MACNLLHGNVISHFNLCDKLEKLDILQDYFDVLNKNIKLYT